MIQEPFHLLGESLDLTRLRVRRQPGLFFLCGGPISACVSGEPSARRHFLSHLADNHQEIRERVVLAEEIKDWSFKGKYKDILYFEEDLAHLTSAIVLFVEGPGSLAELGAFSMLATIVPKVVAVLQSQYQDHESFVSQGPVLRLERSPEASVHYFPWVYPSEAPQVNAAAFEALAEELSGVLGERLGRENAQPRFRPKDPAHQLVLLADAVELAGIANVRDLHALCLAAGIMDLDEARISQLMYVLEKAKLLRRFRYSNQIYYLASSRERHVTLAFKPDAEVVDEVVWRHLFSQHLQRPENKKRSGAFRFALREVVEALHGGETS